MSNLEISKLLRNVAASYIIKDESKFRFQIIAYQKAADTVANLTFELKDYYLENKLDQLPGIGKTLKQHLNELFEKGSATQFEWALKDIPESVFVLMDIPSFGPKKAYKLVKAFKLSNSKTVINELKKLAQKNKISKLEGFGDKSQADILTAIDEFKKGMGKTTRMILPYAFEISEKLIAYLKQVPQTLEANTLGSLRRKAPTVGDIDIAVASDNPKKIIEHFIKYPHIDRIIEKGDVSASILVSGGRQVDLLIQPPKHYGSLLQHFTGSKNHNIHLREIALKKGLSLSERGIKNLKTKKLNAFASEIDFYNAVGLAWIPPELREDQGEIELAANNSLPKLIEHSDLKGDLHLHSNFPIEPSHDLGQSSMEEMIKKAEELKYQYLGFSEHNPSQSKHTNNQIYELIAKRNDHIEHINSNTNKSVRIFKLLETDILPNGDLAIDNKSLKLLDAAIVSIHSLFSMSKFDMTNRILTALLNPKAKILAHPTGRMLNERLGYELDWDKIFEFCSKNNKALEINSWPSRLDLTDNLIKIAINHKVKLIINSDSHSVSQMDMQKYGVFMARRGWATRNDILNTLEYNKFLEWINL